MVIDTGTAALPFWQGLEPQLLERRGIYGLWRLDRRRLERRAADWRQPRPERY